MHATLRLEAEHMIRSLSLDTRISAACGMPKTHKGKLNLPPFRPVVAVAGSSFHCISIWVDMHLR